LYPLLFTGWWCLKWVEISCTLIEAMIGTGRSGPAQILRFPLESVRPPAPAPAGVGRSAKILTLKRT
jgi:hypothetical protein